VDTVVQRPLGRRHRDSRSSPGGNRRLGALLLGVAVLAYRWSPAGIALTLLYHRYGDRITSRALNSETA